MKNMKQAPISHNEFLPYDALDQVIKDSGTENYVAAKPFASGYYDGIFDDNILDAVIEEFYQSQKDWREFESEYEKKLQMNSDQNFGPVTRAFLHNLNSEPFLDFLEKLTGISGLIPDPHFVGGGLHKIPRGGKLGIHVDFNRHKIMRVFRRINVLIYLNKDWEEEYGGHFELWDGLNGTCITKILPIYNRMAIFSTTKDSFHGHPHPLNCPEDRERISLALYYYTAEERGDQDKGAHSTQFLTDDRKRDDLVDRRFKTRCKQAVKALIGKD